MTLLLSAGDLERCLDPDLVASAVEAGFGAYSAGRTETPLRLTLSPPGGVVLTMPCAVTAGSQGVQSSQGSRSAAPDALGAKVVSVFPANASRGLPTVSSLYVLLEPGTGAPLAVADGTYLTAARTAAGSAVATRLLARPAAATLGVFGTGVQARFHVLALARVRSLRHILVAGTSRQKAQQFAHWAAAATGIAASPATPEAVSAADVVAACTTSPTPVVVDGAVRPGAHVNAVGAFTPQTRELPGALIERARVFVDTRVGASAEAGELLIPLAAGAYSLDRIAGELGEVVLGRVPGRQHPRQVTVYKSVGAAFLDAVTARLAYDRARAGGAGTEFAFTAPPPAPPPAPEPDPAPGPPPR